MSASRTELGKRISGVYALVDPRTDLVMYVGQSTDVGKRFQQHRDVNHYEPNIIKRRWLDQLRRAGLEPRLVVLRECDDPLSLNDAEKSLIREYKVRGEAGLNITVGGAGCVIHRPFNAKQQEWVELGNKVKRCRTLLFEIASDVQRMCGTKYSRSANDVIKRLDGFKCVLDSVLARTFPEWTEFTKVFYGEPLPEREGPSDG
jgi:hypothetical protein